MNPLETQIRRQVEVELIRVIVGDREALTSGHPQLADDRVPDFTSGAYADKPVLVGVSLRLSNHSEREIAIFL